MADGGLCRCGRGSLYEVLQVSPWCEPDVLTAAYRALARTRHPDLNHAVDAEEQMRRLNHAYHLLSDPVRRARYDEELALEAARPVVARPAPPPASSAPYQYAATERASPFTGASPSVRQERRSGQERRTGPDRAAPEPPPPFRASYGASFGEPRGEAVLGRSALYVSIILVTAILALVVWLVLDQFADRSTIPNRVVPPPRQQEDRWRPGAQTPWGFEWPAAADRPGLS